MAAGARLSGIWQSKNPGALHAFECAMARSSTSSFLTGLAVCLLVLGSAAITRGSLDYFGDEWAPFVIDEVTLVGSRCGPFDRALAALERGEVTVQPLISERYDLAKGIEALERAQAKSVLKVLLNVG